MVLRDAQYRDLFEAAPDATVIVDEAGKIVVVNSQITRVFGYEPDELVGNLVETLIAGNYRVEHAALRGAYSKQPESPSVTAGTGLFGRRKDGSEFPVDISLTPLRTKDGTWIASAIRDVSDRVEADQNLHARQEFSDQVVNTLQGIVLLLDKQARVMLCNPYFENLTGYAAGEALGRDWVTTFIPKTEQNTIRDYFNAVMRKGMNDGHINAIVLKSGEERLIQWHAKTLSDAEGQTVGLLCTGYDVTEQIANVSALEEARKEAERANAGKSRFLAAASHDLRQPLQSLGLYLSVLSRQSDVTRLSEITDKMRQSLETMGELLNALLDISKLDGGSIQAEKRDLPLNSLLDRIVTDNVQQARAKGLELVCESTDCVVHSDPVLLERIVGNFVTNAIRYTEHGRVTISCRLHDTVVKLAVTDTGFGIPSESLSRIFDEYYQLDNSAHERRKGLGLGLSIAKLIARLLEHPLKVDSVLGKGSTFTVEVPLGTLQVEPAEKPSSAAVTPLGREPVVLLVDDDPAIVDATTMLLELAGVQVHSALNGDDALAHIESGVRPDIVVSDYRLPGYTGIELIRRVRDAAGDDIPTVLVTGDTSAEEIREAHLANCTVLHKPVDTDQLISLIENVSA